MLPGAKGNNVTKQQESAAQNSQTTDKEGASNSQAADKEAAPNGQTADEETALNSPAIDKVAASKYVALSELFTQNSVISNEALEIARVKVGAYAAVYERIPDSGVNAEALDDSIGSVLEGNDGWYRVSGHEEAGYLIHEVEGEYSLWKFAHFLSDEYPYKDVLELVFGAGAAEEIRSVTVMPARMDNSEEGQRIQREIGTRTITDADDIACLYTILSGMTCYGGNRWNLVDYGQSDDGMLDAVRYGRYLAIELKNGCAIDGLKYTAVGGMFYEFGGVAYNALAAGDRGRVEAILGIGGFEGDVPAEGGGSGTYAGVGTYQEAHRYADDVEAIQAAINNVGK